jgi:Galactose oxidase, central domain
MRAHWCIASLAFYLAANAAAQLPPNRWVEVRKDSVGARPGSAIRYVPESRAFWLWGYMNDDSELPQEQPLMRIPEYDMVTFDVTSDPSAVRWRSSFPRGWEEAWSERLPLAYVPRTYSGITSGSERTVMRVATNDKEGAPRPDLNIVFDQVTWAPAMSSLVYFTGGLTAAYDVALRRWTDLAPATSPPPVMGGSLAYDPLHEEIVLSGGGHVAEPGPGGKPVGYTGTWIYNPQANKWRALPPGKQPPPRMNTRMVTDTRNQLLVVFGGDGQSHYLADTWLFDLKTRIWRKSAAPGGPEARAGHFTVFDPETGAICGLMTRAKTAGASSRVTCPPVSISLATSPRKSVCSCWSRVRASRMMA